MGYKKPICDCGKSLKYFQQYIVERYYTITDSGDIGVARKKNEEELDLPYLRCDCGEQYRVDYDEELRILRGDIYR